MDVSPGPAGGSPGEGGGGSADTAPGLANSPADMSLHGWVDVDPSALGRWIAPPWPAYMACWIMTRYVRAGNAMSRVWPCLAESFPKPVCFPREVTTDQPALFEEAEVLEDLEARRLLAEPTPVMGAEDNPVFTSQGVSSTPPILRLEDCHKFHFQARWEHTQRQTGQLVTFPQPNAACMSDSDRRELYPSLLEWWPRVEVPFGFLVLLPRVVDQFGSVLMAGGPTDMVWAMFATHWLLEVVSTWVDCVSIRGML